MAMSTEAVLKQAETMIGALRAANEPRIGFLGKTRRYLDGHQDLPYMPRGAKHEFRVIAEKSITNWLPLVVDTYSKALFVDGYRPAKSSANARAWSYWQKNGLDARQTIVHRAALEYGVGYVLVLPGSDGPVIRPLAPTRVWALYEDHDDDFPVLALIRKGRSAFGERLFELLDEENVYTLAMPSDTGTLRVASVERHNLNVCPIVRFRDRLDGENVGIVRPLFRLQDRVNETVFSLMVALQYASFRQRWATGLAIPEREITDPETGEVIGTEPVEPFEAAVNRLWIADNSEARFGDFAQTEVSGHISTYESTVKTMAAIAQISPHVLLGDLVNLSAEALAAVNDSTTKKAEEYETLFGEAWEQVFRLAAYADDDLEGALDESSEVRWRDTEARSLAQTVDALGKMAQMLQVPAEALWERIPGVTDGDVERWKTAAGRADGIAALADVLARQNAPTPPSSGAVPPTGAAVPVA